MREGNAVKFKVGDDVTWLCTPRGGYGYTFKIPGKVIGHGRARVRIEVKKADGTPAVRFVKEESLRFANL